MVGRQNIARPEILLAIGLELQSDASLAFDVEQFAQDMESRDALDAFRDDLRLARYLGIGRFPTLTLRRPREERGPVLTGYRPYKSLLAAIRQTESEIEPLRKDVDHEAYRTHWGSVLDREFKELEVPRGLGSVGT